MVDICVIMEISLKMHLARWIKRERHYVSFSLGFSWNTEVRNGVKVEVEMGVGSVHFFSSSVVIWKKKNCRGLEQEMSNLWANILDTLLIQLRQNWSNLL